MAKYSLLLLLSFISLFNCVYSTVQCEQKNVNVTTLLNGSLLLGPEYSIATWFCWKQGISFNESTIVHLTIHGITYDHNYWDFPYNETSKPYSYINYMIEKSNGSIVILNLDRLGSGLSDKPLGTFITIPSNAYVIYQLTEKLSTGFYYNVNFTKIILVGHSLGTIITLHVAGNNDWNKYISGIIPTGLLHQLNPLVLVLGLPKLYLAILDPKFENASLPPDYITTKAGYTNRQKLFYNVYDADINVIKLDEILKQTGTLGEVVTLFPKLVPIITPSIPDQFPTLLVMGQNDFLCCNPPLLSCDNSEAIKNREIFFYNRTIEAYVLEKSGHDINLHLNSQDWFEQAFNWTKRHFSI